MKNEILNILKKRWLVIALIAFSGFFILFFRRPDALLTPQFWAEDGKYWYADAYNNSPLSSIFLPYAGSLQVAMRLIASISVFGPLDYAPLFFVVCAIIIKLIPALIINTKRFSSLIPNSKARLLVTFFYLLIPSSFEVHANLTNINWHLALLAFMVLIVGPSSSRLWKIFDLIVIVISCLTGPFAIILAILSLSNFWLRRNKRNKIMMLIICSLSIVQILVLIFGPDNSRLSQPLNPELGLLLKIIGSRIGTSAVIGSSLNSKFINPESWMNIVNGIVVFGITAYAFFKSKYELKSFIFFTWSILIASMIKPQASDIMPQWHALLIGAGSRYFFLPILSLFICLLFIISYKESSYIIRVFCITLIILACTVGVVTDFRYPAQRNLSFWYFKNEFYNTPPGKTYCIPVNPGWEMCLVKH